jgi:uncharacterized protein YwgA
VEVELDTSEFILVLLDSKPDGLSGRTAVQKLGYFASVMIGKNLGYGPDFYGPFSSIVAANLQNLVETDFVNERGVLTANYRKLYTYSLNNEAKALAKTIKKKNLKETKTIQSVVKKCDKIVNCDYNVLSWAAKVHFVLSQQSAKALNCEEAIIASKSFGWTLNKDQVAAGVKLLQELKLIKTK